MQQIELLPRKNIALNALKNSKAILVKNKSEAIYSKKITNEEIVLLVKDIKDYDELLKNGDWLDLPCNYNSYGKNTECEYCKRAEIYQ